MKKLLWILLPLLVLATGCKYDDSDLWEEVNAQKAQLVQLQKQCNDTNSDLTALSTLVGNLQKNVYISSVKQTSNGYTITFTDGTTATISNGKDGANGTNGKDGTNGTNGRDGQTPVIGVSQDTDGIWYWTLNGDWLKDASGNKIPANGKDGKDGITPELKVENGSWWITYDDGATWTNVGPATTEGGDSIFAGVTTDDEYAYFTLADGTVITVPLTASAAVAKLQLVFDETVFSQMNAGETLSTQYTIVAAEGTVTHLDSFENPGWKVTFTPEDEATGTLSITAPDPMDDAKIAIFLTDDNGGSFFKVIHITERAEFDLETEYVVDASAGELILKAPIVSAVVAEDAASWLTAKISEGDIVIGMTANETYGERTGTITLTTRKAKEVMLTITQLQNDAIVISFNRIAISSAEQDVPIVIRSNVSTTVTVAEGADWLADITTKGLTSREYVFRAMANTGDAERSAQVIFASEDGVLSQTVTVTQAKKTAVKGIAFAEASDGAIVVEQGSNVELTVLFTPAVATNQNLTWASDNEAMAIVTASKTSATVSFQSGQSGTVTITATSEDGGYQASQTFFIKGMEPLYIAPTETIYAGKPATYKFNSADYPGASNIIWNVGGATGEGAEAEIAAANGGEIAVTVSADIGGVTVSDTFTVSVEEWWIDTSIPTPANPRNTYPVFNKDATHAYFVTRGARYLYDLDLKNQKIAWSYDLNQGNVSNGGDICVNPFTGDIICSGMTHVVCLTSTGAKKWEYAVPNPSAASSLTGCGPAINNDGTVVFAPVTAGRFMALDASTGEELASYSVGVGNIQYIVYGDDNIVMHVNASNNGIRFLSFDGTAFSLEKAITSPVSNVADITSPAMDKKQKTAYFMGTSGKVVVVDVEGQTASASQSAPSSWTWAPCITPGGVMYHATQTNSMVMAANLSGDILSEGSWTTVFNLGTVSTLNFTGMTCDTEGNGYFYINADGGSFKKIDASTFAVSEIANLGGSIPEYQGVFNYGSHYLLIGGGNASSNRIVARYVENERAGGWSGPGGDVCATKNANLVYAE